MVSQGVMQSCVVAAPSMLAAPSSVCMQHGQYQEAILVWVAALQVALRMPACRDKCQQAVQGKLPALAFHCSTSRPAGIMSRHQTH